MFTAPPPQLRASLSEWTQAGLLVANVAWTTLCLGGYRADTMVITMGLASLAVVLALVRAATVRAPHGWHPAGWLVVPFLVYAAGNVLGVTPVPWLGWQDWLVWAQMAAVFWVAVNELKSSAPRKLVWGALLGLATLAVGIACYQRFARPDWLMLGRTQTEQFLGRSSGPFSIPNSLAALLVLVLPPTLLPVFSRRAGAVTRVACGYLALLFFLGLGLTISRGAWVGLAVALIAWPICAGGRSVSKRLRRAALVGLSVVAVAGSLYVAAPKIRERLDFLVRDSGEKSRPALWRAAWQIFREHPVFGAGAGSYNILFEGYRPESEQKEPKWAHSDYLNTLSDYGAVGFALSFGVAGVVAWQTLRRRQEAEPVRAWDWFDSREFSIALMVGLGAFALHLAVDFHLKIPALGQWVALAAALVIVREWPARKIDGGEGRASVAGRVGWGRAAAGFVAVMVVVGMVWWFVPALRAEALRDAARRRLDGLVKPPPLSKSARLALVAEVRESLTQAALHDPDNSQAWADRAYAAAILGHDDPAQEKILGVAAEADVRRALAQTRNVPEFWLRLGVALDMQHRWREADEPFAEALRLAPASAPTWFYFAYHLSLNQVATPRARAAVAISLRLDPYLPEAESLREILAARH